MGTAVVDEKRLARITALAFGSHHPGSAQMCAMEATAYIAREPWSDHPECVCPVIGAFMRSWNDALPDAERTTLLLPLITKTIGTRGSDVLAIRRATMATDWLVRVHTPAWLRLAGLTAQADALSGLPEITDFAKTPGLMPRLEAVRKDAAAAWAAAGAAAWAAAWAAADQSSLLPVPNCRRVPRVSSSACASSPTNPRNKPPDRLCPRTSNMTTRYMLIEDGDLVDGELMTAEGLFRTLPFCNSGARVLSIDIDEAIKSGSSPVRECTEDMALAGYNAGIWTRTEIRRSMLADYVGLPLTREEQRADEADYLRDIQMEEA